MIRLFIENTEIELDESVQFAITKQFEDLNNPTSIINDWSKTVSIPFTARNNGTFGHIYNPDRIIVSSDNAALTGIYFDPTKKLDMRLQWGDAVLMTGYAKMTDIKQTNGNGTYNITLFGQLGRVLYEMKKITFDQSSPNTEYIIDGVKYVNETYNKELVYNSWTSEGQTDYVLRETSDTSNYKVTDIIGFAPNNAFDKGFDYQSFEKDDTAVKFTDVLNSSTVQFEEHTGIAPDTVIPNGLLPREIGEYRSYLQIPFIYWNKLFQIFNKKVEDITGYSVNLDIDWFSEDNPYYSKLVYILNRKDFDEKTDDKKTNIYVPNGANIWHRESLSVPFSTQFTTDIYFSRTGSVEAIKGVLQNDNKTLKIPSFNNNNFTTTIQLPFSITYPPYRNGRHFYWPGQLTRNNAFQIQLQTRNKYNSILKNSKILVLCEGYTGSYTPSDYAAIINYGDLVFGKGSRPYETTYSNIQYNEFSFNINVDLSEFSDTEIHFTIISNWVNDNMPTDGTGTKGMNIYLRDDVNRFFKFDMTRNNRSFSQFTLNDLWNNDVEICDEIIRYCKMFHIVIATDDINKAISFTPFSNIFKNYTVENWTNKIDKSKDFIITPVSFDSKYVLFQYDDNDTELSKQYKQKYGVTYGSYRLNTNYNFNEKTTSIIEKCKQSITNTDNILSWTNLYNNVRIAYSVPNEIYVYNKDKDKNFVNIFGSFYFHNGLANFNRESELALRSVTLTDDSNYMRLHSSYFYRQSNGLEVLTYPKLDVVNGNNLCLFNVPSECYTYINNYANKDSIYYNIWEKYINERYNIQNKKITCYVDMKLKDFIKFTYNKFVLLMNQLCVVNKIYDYNMNNDETTKVDLITISDVSAYTDANFKPDFLRLSTASLTVPYDHYKTIQVESSKHWELHYNDYQDYLDVYPTEGEAGITTVYIGSIDEEGGYTLQFDLIDDMSQIITSKELSVSVGGATSIEVNPWFNQLEPGGAATFVVNSSTSWNVRDIWNNSGLELSLSPTTGTSGTTNVTFQAENNSDGMADVYIENQGGDIVSVRAYVPRQLLKLSDNNITLSRGSQTTIQLYNDSNASWIIESNVGPSNISISPTTGPARSITTLLVGAPLSGQAGENTIVFVDNGGNQQRAKLFVSVTQ